MARALTDFYVDVLAELGVAGPDRAVSAEDLAVVTDTYAALWNLLEAAGLAYWTQTADIPDHALIPMRWIAAYHVATVFGISGQKLATLRLRGEVDGPTPSIGERILRKRAAVDYIPSPLPVEQF